MWLLSQGSEGKRESRPFRKAIDRANAWGQMTQRKPRIPEVERQAKVTSQSMNASLATNLFSF